MSTMISSEHTFQEAATYGGVVDAIGGVATIVLAIIALSGINQEMLAAIATIVFAAALLIQGGTMLTEYTKLMFPAGGLDPAEDIAGGGGLPALFLVGAAGIVLGVLSLINIVPQTLTAAAVIAFGAALLLSSNSVEHLYRAKHASHQLGMTRSLSGGEILAGEMASGSAVQCLAGLAAIVLGILAVTGANPPVLTLVALLILGATVLLTGSTLSGAMMSFMEPAAAGRGASLPQSSGIAE
jgi:hypothetical protein